MNLQFENENDIPFYFRCSYCLKVPKRFMIDVDCSWIFCLKCKYLSEDSLDTQFSLGTLIEQSILNTITVKCQTCKQFIYANQLRRHEKLCMNQSFKNQMCYQDFIYCKYCQLDCRCNQTNKLLNTNLVPELILEIKLSEFFICQYCFQSISYFETQYHQAICQFYEVICDICEDKFLRNKFMEHYDPCSTQHFWLISKQKQIFKQNIRPLALQQFMYQAEYNIANLEKELFDLLFQQATDEEQQ